MRLLLHLIDDPQEQLRCIHVGGTAGKGSTATMCAAIMTAAGYKVGLHTKPHLRSVTERAKIDGVPIAEERFAELIARLRPVAEHMGEIDLGRPSYFELLVALSFLWFYEENVDLAVIEVGIGGKLDGTNVMTPLVSVLTNVGLDHTDVLGETVEAIAKDKAGIIKPLVPVVTAAENLQALAIIREAATTARSPLSVVSEDALIEARDAGTAYAQGLHVQTKRRSYDAVLPVLGSFQRTNAATAILACEASEDALPFSSADVTRGLESVLLPGRMEFYPSRPCLLFDVAHSVDKARALSLGLKEHFADRRLVFVIAVAENKDAAGMLDQWADLPAQFIFTTFDVSHREAVHAQTLALIAQQRGLTARAVEDPVDALSVARRIAGSADLVVVTGSTFVVATLRQWFSENMATLSHARV